MVSDLITVFDSNVYCFFICILRKKARNRKSWKWRRSFSTCRCYQILSLCCFV